MMRRRMLGAACFVLFCALPALARDLDVRLQHQLLPVAVRFQFVNKDGLAYYQGFGPDKELIGAVFAASGQGYAGLIEVAASINLSGQVLAIKVIAQEETQGLGAEVAQTPFLSQFLNKKPDEFGSIQAVSGATVSSAAVVKMVKEKAEAVLKDMGTSTQEAR